VVLSLYYYALVIKAAYFLPTEEDLPVIILSWPVKLLTVVMIMIIIGGGIFPAYFYELAINAARLLH
jgi:NADH-quinone oxidoreductase subunit N